MKNKPENLCLRYSFLRIIAACYIACPIVIFFIGFLKWYYALVGICAVGYSLYQIANKKQAVLQEERSIEISFRTVLGVFILMLIWTYLGGMNGYWYQSSDYSVRNAILRDLVTHSWPVTYNNGSTALTYYIGHWLPAAIIGKLANTVFHSIKLAWLSARMALWVWSSLGLTILSLLLFLYVKADNRRKRITVVVIMILFSGMDIIGTILEHKLTKNLSAEVLHLEWWSPKNWQYSSITTCLYWVFNQAIVPWIVTMLVLADSNSRQYMFYISSCLLCAPMPTVGLCFLIVGKEIPALIVGIKSRNIMTRLKSIFSTSNIFVLLTCIPIIISYYLCSSTTADIEAKTTVTGADPVVYSLFQLGLFYMLEVGILLLILWPSNKKSILFYVAALSLIVMPLIHVGKGSDFCMRGSIPALFLLMVFSSDYLVKIKKSKNESKKTRRQNCLTIALVTVLVIGAVTPVVEIYRGIYHVISEGTVRLADDALYSFENEADSYNFTTADYQNKLFFSTLTRQP